MSTSENGVEAPKKPRPKNRTAEAALRSFTTEPLHPVSLTEVRKCSCVLCGTRNLLVSAYPFTSSVLFARLLLLHCPKCGLSWVPFIPFDLGEYYSRTYANEIQPFRAYEGRFHDPKNEFWGTRTAQRYILRADSHIDLLYRFSNDVASVLDYGAGLGITLSRLRGVRKYACELDPFSRRILADLNVNLVEPFSSSIQVDAVITSHALEHLPIEEVPRTLAWFRSILKPGGALVLEVPRGYNFMSKLTKKTSHGRFRQEPHTVFFSSLSLSMFLRRAGFELRGLSVCGWTEKRLSGAGEALIPDLPQIRIGNSQLVAVATTKLPTAEGSDGQTKG